MTQGHQGDTEHEMGINHPHTPRHAMVSYTEDFATKVTLDNTPVVLKCQLIKRIQRVCKVISMQLSQATRGEEQAISALQASNLQCLDFLSFETKLAEDPSRQQPSN